MENMAPGYRFYPTEEELVSFYLHNKLEGEREDHMNRVIPVVDIYDYNPWDLPRVSGEASLRDTEQWFFFIPRQESEARGGRPKRLTNTGYWKATGSPNHVYSYDNKIIGMKRTMVFYSGRAPTGKKTDWKMNEYKAIKGDASTSSTEIPLLRQEFSLCRVYKKSKCLRSFDRRPPPRRELGVPCIQQTQGEEGNFTSKSYQSLITTPKVERGSSPESSSSGDMNHGRQPSNGGGEGSSSHQMDADFNALDWEMMDWFLAPDNP